MDTFDAMRFFFDTVYSTFMDIMFAEIVSGIMIDAFSELKEKDQERFDDQDNNCYICGTTKPEVKTSLFRFKNKAVISLPTPRKNIISGTISTTFILFNKKAPPITQVSNLKSIDRSPEKKSTGSPQSEEEMPMLNSKLPLLPLKKRWQLSSALLKIQWAKFSLRLKTQRMF